MSFENLEKYCGGTINPDTLRRFQIAMAEYEMFMGGLSALLAPADADHAITRMKEMRSGGASFMEARRGVRAECGRMEGE